MKLPLRAYRIYIYIYIYVRGLQRCFAARNCCEEPRRGRVIIIFFLSYVYLYRYNNAFLFLRVRVIESRKDIYI